MDLKKICKNNKGVSLLELIIALSIVTMVVGLIFSMLMFGLNAFGMGGTQADLQFEVRRATNNIVDELRNATSISAISQSGWNNIDIADYSIPSDLNPSLNFELTGKLLTLKVSATKDNSTFSMPQEILLNNTSGIIGNTTGVIYYTSPAENDFLTSSLSKDATLKSLVPEEGTLEPDFSPLITNYKVMLESGKTGSRSIPTAITTNVNATVDTTSIATNIISTILSDRTAKAIVTAQDGNTTKTYKVVFEVANAPVLLTEYTYIPSNKPISKKNTEFTLTFATTGGTGPYKYSYSSTGTPTNITVIPDGIPDDNIFTFRNPNVDTSIKITIQITDTSGLTGTKIIEYITTN